MSFVRSYNPVWYFDDLQGMQLDDTYYFFVLQNTFPYLFETVWHDNQGTIPWSNPIQLLVNGTLPIDIFYDPSKVYRLEIRHGNTQSDQLVYEVNDYVPSSSQVTPDSSSEISSENEITNPQFVYVNFYPTFTADTAGTYEIAPGWFLELIGSGTTTISQEVVAGIENFPSNPPYVLDINNTGWTEANLFQRFNNVSGIWANTTINASITGKSELFDIPIGINYVPSAGILTSVSIASGTFNTAAYTTVNGGITLPDSENTDSGADAYVDFVVVLPPTGHVKISNLQLISGGAILATDDPAVVPFIQDTVERQTDHLFHYYANSIVLQSKDNILAGWDFSLNPFQFITRTITTVTELCSYRADQTIVFQNIASQIQTGQGNDANRQPFVVKAVTAATDTRFALIQYIDPATIRPFWSSKTSCLVKVKLTNTQDDDVRMKMRLIYRRSLPPTIGDDEPITAWAADSDPEFAAGWTEILPLNDPEYLIPSETASGVYNDYQAFAFNQFQLPDNTTSDDTLGVVFYTMDNLNSVAASENSVNFGSISMVKNDFAIDISPMTYDESLRRCQFYYEKSYADGVLPGANTSLNKKFISSVQSTDSAHMYRRSFSFDFVTVKRLAPTLKFYSTDGTVDTIKMQMVRDGSVVGSTANEASSGWSQDNSVNRVSMGPSDSHTVIILNSTNVGNENQMQFHYTADSRMGI